MKKLIPILSLATTFLLPVVALRAQLAPPNEAGVTMGQVRLNVRNVEATKRFFLEIGGTPTKLGAMEVIKYPGVLIILAKANPSDGSEGSTVNHIAFLVKDGKGLVAKMKDEGAKVIPDNFPGGGYIYSPDGVKIEIFDRPALPAAAQFDQVHFFVADPAPDGGISWAELQTWYAKTLGATIRTTVIKGTPDSRGVLRDAFGLPGSAASEISGTRLNFSKIDTATVGTKGRALDHIGFEVKGLEAFCKRLEASGVKLNVPYTARPKEGIATAFMTDPWGTYIELTEGLDKL